VRIGIGYDLHPLKTGRALVIGGVTIKHKVGLDGHSDADVLTHAIIDALLGAASLGNIGERFPSNDAQYAGISSLELLARAAIALEVAGFRVINIDSTVIAEGPRLQPHLGAMQANLAECLKLDRSAVSVKATSPEGLGAVGRELGIAAQAVALIEDR
jgi:2-C-methyl-D-erythritol 2,4-cyclodiphosphate synthase